MAPRLIGVIMLLALLSACSTPRLVRLDMRQGHFIIHIPREGSTEPVELSKELFTKALAEEARQRRASANPEKSARELLGIPPRSGWYGYTQREGVVPLDGQPPASQWAEVDVRVTREYLRFCEALGKPGDCRRALMNNPVLTGDGRHPQRWSMDAQVPETL